MNGSKIRFGKHELKLPGSRLTRTAIGVSLIIGGILGFLPILGFWMIPLGLLVLSVDSPYIRRGRRRATIWLGARLKRHAPSLARRLGFS